MEEEKKKYANELKEDIHQFLKTGDSSLHSIILNKLCLSNAALSDISFEQIQTLFSLLNAINDTTSQIFISNGIKQLIRLNYTVFSQQEKFQIYKLSFSSYAAQPDRQNLMEQIIVVCFKYFYDSITLECSLLEDVKQFCENSVEHLRIGLHLFCSIIEGIQDYEMPCKCANQIEQRATKQQNLKMLTGMVQQSQLSSFHRKREIHFRHYTLPLIFDIPFQLLNSKKEYLIDEAETSNAVLSQVLELLTQCLNYDYFDQKKTSDEKFIADSSILSIPCREKKSEGTYLSDLKSQDFTSTLFELYYFMVNKHPAIATQCLVIVSLLTRLSVKFFKKEDQKFQQMMYIIDGLLKIMQNHNFLFDSFTQMKYDDSAEESSLPQLGLSVPSFFEQNISKPQRSILLALCTCISKIPIGISFSDVENFAGFWDWMVIVQKITKQAIVQSDFECLELLLEFWCGYDYFLGHDGAQKQEQLRELVEEILRLYVNESIKQVKLLKNGLQLEQFHESQGYIISSFAQLANTWIDQIEKTLMSNISELFEIQSKMVTIDIRKKNEDNINGNNNQNNIQSQNLIEFQLYWNLELLFNAQSYNMREEMIMANKHFELDSQEEIKEDIDILHQAFQSFAKLFSIILNIHAHQNHMNISMKRLIKKVFSFLINQILAFKNHIHFDYLGIIVKFTEELQLKEHFQLNEIIIEYLNGIVNSSERHNKDKEKDNMPYDWLIQLLGNITKHLHATDTGVQIGCFPFDVQGLFESDIMRQHNQGNLVRKQGNIENQYINSKSTQRIYEYLFRVVDKHEQYKKISMENDFERLIVKASSQDIHQKQEQVDSQEQGLFLNLSESNNLNGKDSKNSNKNNSSCHSSKSRRRVSKTARSSPQSQSYSHNNIDDPQQNPEIESIHSQPVSVNHPLSSNESEQIRHSLSIQQASSNRLQKSQTFTVDYFNIFLGAMAKNLQIDSSMKIEEQKLILRNVLDQLIGIVRSSTMHTYQRVINFIQTQNIFFAIRAVVNEYQVIGNGGEDKREIDNQRKYDNHLGRDNNYQDNAEKVQVKGGDIQERKDISNEQFQQGKLKQSQQPHSSSFQDVQKNKYNIEVTNCALKFITEVCFHRVFLPQEIQESLNREVIQTVIDIQKRMLSQEYNNYCNTALSHDNGSASSQLNQSPNDEFKLLIKPLSYQFRIIYSLLQSQQQLLNFSELPTQLLISNMFYSFRMLTPEKITHYHRQLHWIYAVIHSLAQSHFEIFLLLQPLEFQSIIQIMEESLRTTLECDEAIDFFVSLLQKLLGFKNKKEEEDQTMQQHLMCSIQSLMSVLQLITMKIIRKEDLNEVNISRLMLGFHWMLGREKMLASMYSSIQNYPAQSEELKDKFIKYQDEIEILDSRQYDEYMDGSVLLEAKIVFKRVFGQ